MSKVISIALRKGGSGKTTTAVNLAAALHKSGKKTLLIDLDSQCYATLACGIDPMTFTRNIDTLFTDTHVTPQQVVINTAFGLPLIPAHPEFAKTSMGMTASQTGVLKPIIDVLKKEYEYIILDTPPSEAVITVAALTASDEVIVPLQVHFFALQGLIQLVDEVKKIQNGLNPKLKIAGILPTMATNRANITKQILKELREAFKELVYPFQVDFSIKHTEASMDGQPIVIFDPAHQGAITYKKLATIIAGE